VITKNLTLDVRWSEAERVWVLSCERAPDLRLMAATVSELLELAAATFTTTLNTHFAQPGSTWTYEISVMLEPPVN
jgi:hypothetical protein